MPAIKLMSEETEEMIATSLGFGDDVTSATGAESREMVWDDEE